MQMLLTKVKSYWSKMGPKSHMAGVLIKRAPREQTETKREGRVRMEDWGEAATSQGTSKMASNPPEAKTR